MADMAGPRAEDHDCFHSDSVPSREEPGKTTLGKYWLRTATRNPIADEQRRLNEFFGKNTFNEETPTRGRQVTYLVSQSFAVYFLGVN